MAKYLPTFEFPVKLDCYKVTSLIKSNIILAIIFVWKLKRLEKQKVLFCYAGTIFIHKNGQKAHKNNLQRDIFLILVVMAILDLTGSTYD